VDESRYRAPGSWSHPAQAGAGGRHEPWASAMLAGEAPRQPSPRRDEQWEPYGAWSGERPRGWLRAWSRAVTDHASTSRSRNRSSTTGTRWSLTARSCQQGQFLPPVLCIY